MLGNLFSEADIIIIANLAVWLVISLVGGRIFFLKREVKDRQIKEQSGSPHALDDLQLLFTDKAKRIRRLYPSLTDTDMQVLTLIGLGVDNADILQFTGMSKRTYYKRRQLIAQRMNTTAAQLDELVKQLFTSK